jgi:hypothetical protein
MSTALETMDVEIQLFDPKQQERRRQLWRKQLNGQLPPSPEDIPEDDPDMDAGFNNHRAQWASLALQTFVLATGSDLEDSVADLLTDLAHWCDRHGLYLSHEFERAKDHYDAETDGTGEQF